MDLQNNIGKQTPYPQPENIMPSINEIAEPLSNATEGIKQGIEQASQGIIQGVQNASQGLSQGLQQVSQGVINNAQQVSQNLGNGIANASQNLGNGIMNTSQNLGNGIMNTSQNLGSGIANASQNLGSGIVNASQELGSGIVNASQGLGNKIVETSNNIGQGIDNISKSVVNIPENVMDSISDTFTLPKDSSLIGNVGTENNFFNFETIFTIFLLIGLLALIIVYGFQYFYNIDLIAKIKNIFTTHPEVEIKVEKKEEPEKKDAIDNDVGQILKRPQVFNIPDNNFIYDDAKALCKAYGARLATYEELEEAYNKGAEWCNYGWSEGQMALFPTQQKTWNKLQTIEGHENDCGRPGINGGYMANKALRYGVNCYGYKPRITKTEKELMNEDEIYPKTKEDEAIEKRTEYWKDKLSEILVSPFNHDKWSKI
jgi:hypothetical protein